MENHSQFRLKLSKNLLDTTVQKLVSPESKYTNIELFSYTFLMTVLHKDILEVKFSILVLFHNQSEMNKSDK